MRATAVWLATGREPHTRATADPDSIHPVESHGAEGSYEWAVLDAPLFRTQHRIAAGGLGFPHLVTLSQAAFVGNTAMTAATATRIITASSMTAECLKARDDSDGDSNGGTHPPFADPYIAIVQQLSAKTPALAKLLDESFSWNIITSRASDFQGAQTAVSALLMDHEETRFRGLLFEGLAEEGSLECRVRRDAYNAASSFGDGASSLASAWLTIPGWAPGCAMPDNVFTVACSSRLGLPPPGMPIHYDHAPVDGEVTCKCNKPADSLGTHAHVCRPCQGSRSSQHRQLVGAVKACARNAGQPAVHEPWIASYYPRDSGGRALAAEAGQELSSDKTRGDLGIIFENNTDAQPAIVDVVSCAVTSGAKNAKPLTAKGLELQLAAAERIKVKRYSDWPIPDGQLIPFAISLGGQLGKSALELLRRLARFDNYDDPFTSYRTSEPDRFRAFVSRVSAALQRTKAQTYYRWVATQSNGDSATAWRNTLHEAYKPANADEEAHDADDDEADATSANADALGGDTAADAEAPGAGDEEVDATGADTNALGALGEAAAAHADEQHTDDENDVSYEEARANGAGLEDNGAAALANEPDGEGADTKADEGSSEHAPVAEDDTPTPPTPKTAHAPAPPPTGSRKRRLSLGEADTDAVRNPNNHAAAQTLGSRKRTLSAATGGWDEDSE